MCQLNSCCCCCSLRTGSLTIGYLNLIAGGLALVSNIVYISRGYLEAMDQAQHMDERTSILMFLLLVFVGIILGLLIICYMLVYGIHKEKPRYMRPWLILGAIGIFLESIGCMYLLCELLMHPNEYFPFALLAAVRLAVGVYCFSCVLSLYKQMKGQQQLHNADV